DYLLRDSLHTGVAYGRFDHHRLIQTMRILPPAPDLAGAEEAPTGEEAARSTLGVVRGGLESAEGLLVARYFMFSQVYFHWTRLTSPSAIATARASRQWPCRRCSRSCPSRATSMSMSSESVVRMHGSGCGRTGVLSSRPRPRLRRRRKNEASAASRTAHGARR